MLKIFDSLGNIHREVILAFPSPYQRGTVAEFTYDKYTYGYYNCSYVTAPLSLFQITHNQRNLPVIIVRK